MKSLPNDAFSIRPFVVHKNQNLSYTFLSESRNSVLSIDIATQPPGVWAFNPATDFQNTGSNIFSGPLYKSVHQTFYQSTSFTSGTIVNRVAYPTGSPFFYPSGSTFYVLSLSSSVYGEGITPGTFTITAPLSTASIVDDGNGNLLTTGNGYVGNIFYGTGLAVFQKSAGVSTASIVSPNGLFLSTSSVVNISFDSTRTIYEYQIICTIGMGEMNMSVNPSVLSTQYIGSGSVQSLFASGSLTPYITSIGCYNDVGQLLAVAKFPKPVSRAVNSQQTIILRFDL